jgi:acyl carrier protein
MDDIEARIIELVAKTKNLPPSSVLVDSTFEELQIDSLDKINLSFAVEEMFSIEIPDDSLNSLKTVGDVVRGVERLRALATPDTATPDTASPNTATPNTATPNTASPDTAPSNAAAAR